jgi:hypothetical protein
VAPAPSTVIKLKRTTTAAAVPTTNDLEDGEIAVNITDKKVFVRNGGSIITVANFTADVADIDLGAITQSIIPLNNNAIDLGTSSKRWRDLYLSGNTLNIGGATISSDGTGTISISASGATLPLNSNVLISGAVTKTIALAGADGSPVQAVPFFTAAGGIVNENTKLDFKADPDKIVANFTLSTGTTLGSEQGSTLFFF